MGFRCLRYTCLGLCCDPKSVPLTSVSRCAAPCLGESCAVRLQGRELLDAGARGTPGARFQLDVGSVQGVLVKSPAAVTKWGFLGS